MVGRIPLLYCFSNNLTPVKIRTPCQIDITNRFHFNHSRINRTICRFKAKIMVHGNPTHHPTTHHPTTRQVRKLEDWNTTKEVNPNAFAWGTRDQPSAKTRPRASENDKRLRPVLIQLSTPPSSPKSSRKGKALRAKTLDKSKTSLPVVDPTASDEDGLETDIKASLEELRLNLIWSQMEKNVRGSSKDQDSEK